ncbi:MAG: outer membrane beta-barrel protein [Cytophagales bacterium]
MKRTLYIALGLAALTPAFARKNNTADSATTEPAGKMVMSGYVDTYFFKNLNNPLSGGNATNSGFERIFDQKEGQFQLGLVQTKFAYSTSKAEAVVDLTFGPNADLGNYGNYNSLNLLKTANNSDITSTALAIKQAYLTYKITSKLSATAGLFGTHIGYEVIDAPVNYNYSLSNLFGNGPFYHLGAKATYAFSDKLSLMGGVVNNWDNNFDNNRYKTVISQLFVSPAKGWNVYLNWIGGYEDSPVDDTLASQPIAYKVASKQKALKHMFDLTTGYQITDKFYMGLNGAIGFYTKQGDGTETKNWGGVALYSNYAITSMFGIGVRGEYFDNTQGVQYLKNHKVGPNPVGTDVTSITVTPTLTLDNGHLLLKPEFRIDSYKKMGIDGGEQLEDKDGAFTKSSQSTFGMSAVYKF